MQELCARVSTLLNDLLVFDFLGQKSYGEYDDSQKVRGESIMCFFLHIKKSSPFSISPRLPVAPNAQVRFISLRNMVNF